MTTNNFDTLLQELQAEVRSTLMNQKLIIDQNIETTIIQVSTFGMVTCNKPSVTVTVTPSTPYGTSFFVFFSKNTKHKGHVTPEVQKQLMVYEQSLNFLRYIDKEYDRELTDEQVEQIKTDIANKKKLLVKKSKQERTIDELNSLFSDSKVLQTSENEIDWISNHVKNITATIPDYLEDWFNKTFGYDTPKNVVDSKKKTSGGYSMKWNPSFSILFKDIDDAIPISLKNKLVKNRINDTKLVFNLVQNYGFSFGRS